MSKSIDISECVEKCGTYKHHKGYMKKDFYCCYRSACGKKISYNISSRQSQSIFLNICGCGTEWQFKIYAEK